MSCVPFSEDADSLEPLRVAQGFRGPGPWWPCSPGHPQGCLQGHQERKGAGGALWTQCGMREQFSQANSYERRSVYGPAIAVLARFCSCCSKLCELSYFPAYSVVVRGPGFLRRVVGWLGPGLAGLFLVHQKRPTSWPPLRSLSSRQPPASS